jgi:hypothetical protein
MERVSLKLPFGFQGFFQHLQDGFLSARVLFHKLEDTFDLLLYPGFLGQQLLLTQPLQLGIGYKRFGFVYLFLYPPVFEYQRLHKQITE